MWELREVKVPSPTATGIQIPTTTKHDYTNNWTGTGMGLAVATGLSPNEAIDHI